MSAVDPDGEVIVVPEVVTEGLDNEVDADALIRQAIVDGNDPEFSAGTDADGGGDSSDDVGRGGRQPSDADESQEGGSEDLILGRFKTADDLAQAYQNLEPKYTQTSQQMRELERQVAELNDRLQYQQSETEFQRDFEFQAPFSENPRNIEELEALAEQAPDKAAMFVEKNADKLPPELVQEVMNYWHARNPAQATAYMLQQMFQSYLPAVDQRLAPTENRHQETVVNSAVDMAEKMIGPQYDQYHDRIIDAIENNPSFLPQDLNNPEAMRDSIVNVYALLVGRDMLERGNAAAAQGRQQAPTQARTQTRTPATPQVSQEDVDNAAAIQKMILNAQ